MKLLNTNKLTEFLNIATHPERSNKSTAQAGRSDGTHQRAAGLVSTAILSFAKKRGHKHHHECNLRNLHRHQA